MITKRKNARETSIEFKSILKKKHSEFLLNKQLIKMVEIGDLTQVKKLINEGATLFKLSGKQLDLYNSRSEQNTLLHTAVKLGHADIAEYLIQCGCDVNSQTRRQKATPLHYATYLNTPSAIINILLDNGANIEAKDDDNATPFMWACYLNNTRALKPFLDRGVDHSIVDNFGLSSLEWACHQGHTESVTFLIKYISYSKAQLQLAYLQALESGQINIIKLLEKKLQA